MKKQGFIYGSVILAASAVITKLIGAFFRIPLAGLLGGTGMGYFSCAYGIFLPVYAVTAAGLPAAAACITARDIASNGGASLRRIKNTALLLFTAAGLAGMLIIMAAALPFCRYAAHDSAALPSVIMIAPAVLFGCPCAVLRGFCEGRRNMYPTALSQVAEALTKLAAGLCGAYGVTKLFYSDPDLFCRITGTSLRSEELALSYASAAACGGISLSVLAGLVFMIIYDLANGRKAVSEVTGKGTVMSAETVVRELTAIAVPGAVCALVTNITSMIDLATIMNSLETAYDRDPSVFAQYALPRSEIPNFIYGSFSGLAITVFNLVPSVTNMFGRGILPIASEAYGNGDKKALAKCSEDVIFAAGAVSIPCGIGITVLARPILSLLFSDSKAEIIAASPSLSAMGAGIIFLCISAAIFPVFQAAGRQDIPVKLMAAGAAVKAAGNILLVPIPRLNAVGAAISTDISYFVVCTAALILLKRITGCSLKNIFSICGKLFFAGILCGAGAYLSYDMLTERLGGGVSTVVSVCFGAVIYIISTYFEGLFDKSTLKMLISQKN
ncbi:MAG: polysaccharide biosynthesis C-terminal domain-containing protein [Oscillospiraceae bacterium]|nr:polysaccharide biosynthesis C-terminal domain-containing protein [Oscillospiraceae bacterium]